MRALSRILLDRAKICALLRLSVRMFQSGGSFQFSVFGPLPFVIGAWSLVIFSRSSTMLAAPARPLSPSTAQESPPDHPPTASRRAAWKPDGDAHLIYQWVKIQGKPQSEVAAML